VGPWLGKDALRTLADATRVITVSGFIRDDALHYGLPAGNVTTLLNSIELPPAARGSSRDSVRAEFGIPGNAPLAGIVARISDDKGHADVIEAMAHATAAVPEARLLIVGDGPSRAEIEGLVSARNLSNRTVFSGRRRDVARLLSALDVFIHPSRRDPCPLAVLEAAATGLPVVAYADGGIPELVLGGGTGLLVPSGDRAALGRALAELLGDPERAHEMGRRSRQRIGTEFRPEDAGARFAQILREVVRAGSGVVVAGA
jgi:glycosyltransferase involved in cell wall biosynthesis